MRVRPVPSGAGRCGLELARELASTSCPAQVYPICYKLVGVVEAFGTAMSTACARISALCRRTAVLRESAGRAVSRHCLGLPGLLQLRRTGKQRRVGADALSIRHVVQRGMHVLRLSLRRALLGPDALTR